MVRRDRFIVPALIFVLGWNLAFALASAVAPQARAYLPNVRIAETATPGPLPDAEFRLDEGIWHLTNTQGILDGAGVEYVSTRLSSDIGGVVYRVDGDELVEVLRLGPDVAHANGELQELAGYGYLYTVSKDQTVARRVAIPGWVRLP
jgi:hypothetical protein